jgi:hypothetical protein
LHTLFDIDLSDELLHITRERARLDMFLDELQGMGDKDGTPT